MLPQTIGRYEVLRQLGRGGMATVYLARDPHFRREVALKVLPAAFLHDPTFRARFQREAQIIAGLEHPAIVPVYDYGEEAGQPFLVMRFMAGGTLGDRLASGSLSLDEAVRIIARVAAALDRAHAQGIVHRDLKPANILFDQYGDAYLTDFGIVKIVAETDTDLTGSQVVGTPAYMSPEQAQGSLLIDRRSDVYALGTILFEMLTGRTPYTAETPMGLALKHVTAPIPSLVELRPDLPPALEGVIGTALAKDPERRYQSAGELAKAIENALQQPQPQALGHEDLEPAARAPRRPRPSWLLLVAAGLIVLVLVTVALAGTLLDGATPAAATPPTIDVPPSPPSRSTRPAATAVGGNARPTETTARATVITSSEAISTANVARVVEMAEIGRGSLNDALLSPSGNQVAIAGSTGIWTYAADDLALLHHFQESTRPIRSVAWSPNEVSVAAAGDEGVIWVWDVATGDLEGTLPGHEGWVRALAWSPENSLLASGGNDSLVRVWDVPSGREQQVLRGHTATVRDLAWAPDGTRLASSGNDGEIRIWDTAAGELLLRLTGHEGIVFALAWMPDGSLLASAGSDGLIRLWDTSTGQEQRTLVGHSGLATTVTWASNTARLASGGEDGTIRVWDVASGNELRQLSGHRGIVNSVSWMGDNNTLLSTGEDGTMRRWAAPAGQELITIEEHSAPINSVAWAADGDEMALGSSDHSVHVKRMPTIDEVATFSGHTAWVSSVAWSPDGSSVASSDFNGNVRLWDRGSGSQRLVLRHGAIVNSIAWSADGEFLASGGNDAAVRIWDPVSGQAVAEIVAESDVASVAWAGDSAQLAAAAGNKILVWDRFQSSLVSTLDYPSTLLDVVWAPDASRLASVANDGTVQIWDPSREEPVLMASGHEGQALAVDWSPETSLLVTAGFDGLLHIWNGMTLELVGTLRGHTYAIWDVAWNPSGTLILSGSGDGTARLWGIPTGRGEPANDE